MIIFFVILSQIKINMAVYTVTLPDSYQQKVKDLSDLVSQNKGTKVKLHASVMVAIDELLNKLEKN